MFVALPLLSVMLTVCWSPETVREADAVTFGFDASALSPVKFA